MPTINTRLIYFKNSYLFSCVSSSTVTLKYIGVMVIVTLSLLSVWVIISDNCVCLISSPAYLCEFPSPAAVWRHQCTFSVVLREGLIHPISMSTRQHSIRQHTTSCSIITVTRNINEFLNKFLWISRYVLTREIPVLMCILFSDWLALPIYSSGSSYLLKLSLKSRYQWRLT